MKKLKSLIYWITINAAFLYCAWQGMFHNNVGFGNIYTFSMGMVATMYAAIVFVLIIAHAYPNSKSVHEFSEQMENHNRVVPRFISHGLDFVMTFMCVYHSWWFTAVLLLLLTTFEAMIYALVKHMTQKPTQSQSNVS